MALPPQKNREMVLQYLFSMDLLDGDCPKELPSLLMAELKVTKKSSLLACDRAKDILSKKEELDQLIQDTSTSYAFDRIQLIERNILRIGIYELLHDETVPPKVVISEGIRLAKKFSTAASSSFIHALLDAIHQKNQGNTIDQEELSRSSEELIQSEEIASDASIQQPLPDDE